MTRSIGRIGHGTKTHVFTEMDFTSSGKGKEWWSLCGSANVNTMNKSKLQLLGDDHDVTCSKCIKRYSLKGTK